METINYQIKHNRIKTKIALYFFVIFDGVIGFLLGFIFSKFFKNDNQGNDFRFVILISFFVMFIFIFLSTLYILWIYSRSNKIFTNSLGATELQPTNSPEIFSIVAKLGKKMHVPMPKIYIIGDKNPNVLVLGKDPQHAIIGINAGILKFLNYDELKAVLASEIVHIRNYDIRLNSIIIALINEIFIPIAKLVSRCWYFLFFSFWSGIRNKYNNWFKKIFLIFEWFFSFIFLIVGIVLMFFLIILALIEQFLLSPKKELFADKAAVNFLENPSSLVSALNKIQADRTPTDFPEAQSIPLYSFRPQIKKKLFRFVSTLYNNHISLSERIKQLGNKTKTKKEIKNQ